MVTLDNALYRRPVSSRTGRSVPRKKPQLQTSAASMITIVNFMAARVGTESALESLSIRRFPPPLKCDTAVVFTRSVSFVSPEFRDYENYNNSLRTSIVSIATLLFIVLCSSNLRDCTIFTFSTGEIENRMDDDDDPGKITAKFNKLFSFYNTYP